MTSIVEVTLLRVRLEKAERERDEARAALSMRYALSREIEEILGVPSATASDEQLALGVAAAKRIVRDLNEAHALIDDVDDELAKEFGEDFMDVIDLVEAVRRLRRKAAARARR
jgi:hypothetical protein